MFSFFAKQKPALGLDISDSSLRMMELTAEGSGFFPHAYAELPLPKGVVAEGEVKNALKVAELIERAWRHPNAGRFTTPYVALSVPESKSFVRVISVMRMSAEEAAAAVPLEAEQYVPVAADQTYLDFRILPEKNESSDKMKVLITAAPKSLVEQYVAVVKDAGLKPAAVEVESEAVARCLVEKLSEPTLIADISTTRTSLIIYDQQSLQFTSSIPVAGNAFTAQIAQSFTLSFEEAEKLKLQSGLDSRRDQGKLRESLQSQLRALVDAIRNAINFYREHSEGNRLVVRVLLTGGGSRIRGLEQYLSQEIGVVGGKPVNVEIGDPWVNVLGKPLKRVPPIPKGTSVSFSTAIGLALRGIEIAL